MAESGPGPDAQPTQPAARSTAWLAARVVVLAILWVAVNLWVTTHFGKSLTEIGTVNAVLAAAAAILALLPERQRQGVGEEKTRLIERLMQRLLSPTMLLCLVLAFVIFGSFVSSVRIERTGVLGGKTVDLLANGRSFRTADLAQGEEILRLVTWTLPYFGRDLKVRVSGLGERDVDLGPWHPAVMSLDELPGVLLRVAMNDLGSLVGGSLRFVCLDGNRADESVEMAIHVTHEDRALVGLGAAGDPDDETVDEWVADFLSRLRGAGVEVDEGAPIAAKARKAWSTAERGPELPCFQVGRNIHAVLCTQRHRPWASADLTVGPGLTTLVLERSNQPGAAPFDEEQSDEELSDKNLCEVRDETTRP